MKPSSILPRHLGHSTVIMTVSYLAFQALGRYPSDKFKSCLLHQDGARLSRKQSNAHVERTGAIRRTLEETGLEKRAPAAPVQRVVRPHYADSLATSRPPINAKQILRLAKRHFLPSVRPRDVYQWTPASRSAPHPQIESGSHW